MNTNCTCNYKNFYALIIEDDARFQFRVINWQSFIDTLPKPWTIAQLLVSNTNLAKYIFDNIWLGESKLWFKRNSNSFWGAVAYLINLESLKYLFKSKDLEEINNLTKRYPDKHDMLSTCNRNNHSMASKIRCKGRNNPTSDRFIYSLGNPNTYVLTIPLLTMDGNANSTLYDSHTIVQNNAIRVYNNMKEIFTNSTNFPQFIV